MIFIPTKIEGVWILEMDRHEDDRGWFARSWCAEEFSSHGLNPCLAQCNLSFNKRRATLRGMHYQAAPHEEAKLVRCTRGTFVDVALDLRHDSATFKQSVSTELSSANGRALYIPKGCAHGFQTLEDETEVAYFMAESYHPECARGVRWDDPAFDIAWPLPEMAILSPRDTTYPDFAS